MGGTLTSEPLGLGPSDLAPRWIGIRHHQVVLVVLGVVGFGDALLRTSSPVEALAGLILVGATLPLGPSTVATLIATVVAFAARRRWSKRTVVDVGGRVLVDRRGVDERNGFVLDHRGRFDLNGADHRTAAGLATYVDALAANRSGQRLSLHVRRRATSAATLLVVPADAGAPRGWHRDDGAVAAAASARRGTTWWLERWRYVRSEDGVACAVRVRDFAVAAGRGALLGGLQALDGSTTLSIHLDVVGGERARRTVERAVHRYRSDRAAATAVGFRATARLDRADERVRQREVDVAAGHALMRLGVYLTVRAESWSALRSAREAAIRRATDAGLRVERGGGHQARWVVDQATGPSSRWATHWITSSDLDALRVPAHDAGTGLTGAPLGVVVGGAPFVLDPFDLYRAGVVANPNVIVAGAIGAGKSTIVKMTVERALARGRRAVVIDPKGEYGALAGRHGCRAVALGVDGWCDPFGDVVDGRSLVRAMVASAQSQPLTDEQHFALDEVWDAVAATRPPRLLRALAEGLHGALDDPTSPRRALALTLRRFVEGDLAGLFDGDDEPLRLDGDLVVLDLSAQWSSDSMAVAALSAVAAAQRVAASAAASYVVLDEAWALLSDPNALAWLRGSWKLARSRGISHVLVVHRWGDVDAVGDAGSQQRERARGLLRECETAWLFRQPPDEVRDMGGALALGTLERQILSELDRGEALVRYGRHRSLVRVTPNETDSRLIDTDAAMRA